MAEERTPEQVRSKIVGPLMSIAGELTRICEDWEAAIRDGKTSRSDLLLNERMAIRAVDEYLPGFSSELKEKVDLAKRGAYRYRASEKGSNRKKKKKADT
jgi:hypothetical protein